MVATQALGALLLALAGFAFGLALDLYRVLRRLGRPGRILTVVCDLLFWLAYASWIYILLLRTNAGEVRYHVFLCLAAGAGSYFWLFSRYLANAWYTVIYRLMRAANRIADWLSRAVDACLLVLLWPYRVLVRYLLGPLWRLGCWLLSPLLWLQAALLGQVRKAARWLFFPVVALARRLQTALAKLFQPPAKDS